MQPTRTTHRYSLLLSITLTATLSACTGGRVIYDGDPASSTTVTYTNCNGDTWTKSTNSSGYFIFNPFDPDSSAIDSANYIPEGVYLASAQKGVWKVSNMVSHEFDATCEIEWNNEVQDLPCTRRDFDLGFKPLSGWEYNAKLEAQKEHNSLQSYSFFIEYCIHFGGGN